MDFSLTDAHYEEKITAKNALYKVIDPELFINVVDLGLIYDIQFLGDEIVVTMTLSTPYCPMGEAITTGVKNALKLAFPDKIPVIDLTFEPEWNYEMLTPEGRQQLGV